MGVAAGTRALLAVVVAATVSCGGGTPDPRCVARQALRDAVRTIGQAETAETAGDTEAVQRRMADAEQLVRSARWNLSPSTSSSVERAMLEAAEYLDFIVGEYLASGAVDGTLAQFATRELNRAPAPGEAPLSC